MCMHNSPRVNAGDGLLPCMAPEALKPWPESAQVVAAYFRVLIGMWVVVKSMVPFWLY